MAEHHNVTVREAVAVFHDEVSLDAAIEDLEEHGFDRAEISLMASEGAVQKKLGDRYSRVEDAADDPATPRQAVVMPEDVGAGEGALIGGLAYVGAIAAVGTVVASGGAMLTVAAAALAAGAGGGVLGGILAHRLGSGRAKEIQDHLAHGGLLIWVRTRDVDHEERALKILGRHTSDPVRIHDIPLHDPTVHTEKDLERYDVGLPWLFRMKHKR